MVSRVISVTSRDIRMGKSNFSNNPVALAIKRVLKNSFYVEASYYVDIFDKSDKNHIMHVISLPNKVCDFVDLHEKYSDNKIIKFLPFNFVLNIPVKYLKNDKRRK